MIKTVRQTGRGHLQSWVSAIWLLLLAALSPAFAQSAVYPETTYEVDVTIQRAPALTGAGIKASYRFTRPLRQFTFQEILTANDAANSAPLRDVLRDGNWRLLSNELILRGGVVQRMDGAPFSGFDVLIDPDTVEYGRVYPAIVPLGEGVVIGVNYLLGDRSLALTRFLFDAEEGAIVLGGNQPAAEGLIITMPRAGPGVAAAPESHVVFMGPRDYFIDGDVRVVRDPATPDWVLQTVLEEARANLSFFTDKFGEAGGTTPTFLLTFSPEDTRARWRGDVSAEGLIAMRLRGTGWYRQTISLAEELALFVSHEVNHLWNGRRYPHAGGEANAWLHEGGAEYMAIKARHARGLMSDQRFDQLMLVNTNRCLRELGYQIYGAGSQRASLSGGALYTCGSVVQWIADAAYRREGADIFTLWRTLFEKTSVNGEYSANDFFAALDGLVFGAQATKAIQLLVASENEDALGRLAGSVEPLGIAFRDAEEQLTARRFIGRLVMPLLRDYCAPPHDFGIRWAGSRYVLDVNVADRCNGVFGTGIGLMAVEGFDLFAAPSEAYDAALARCNAGAPLTFSTLDRGNITFACRTALPPRPRQLALTAPWASREGASREGASREGASREGATRDGASLEGASRGEGRE